MTLRFKKTAFFFAVSALLCASAADTPGNLLKNPGFESPGKSAIPEGYKKGAHYGKRAPDKAFLVDASQKHSGGHSLKIISEADFPAIIQSEEVDVQPGETYLLSLYAKAEGDTPKPCRLFILSTDFKCSTSRNFFADGTRWKLHHVLLKINQTQKSNKIYARFDLMEQGAVWIDDLVLRKVSDDFDLSTLDKTAYGYRERPDSGARDVPIAIGAPTGRKLPAFNGACFFHPKLEELKLKVVRVHNVMTSFGIINRDAEGKLFYKWDRLDKYLDDVVRIGAVPQMCLCFVPLELVAYPDPQKIRMDTKPQYYLAPPTDLEGWDAAVTEIINHCAQRYDISGWYWIFANEPGVRQFSMGTQEEFYGLYKRTVAAALKARPGIKIGAASFAHMDWLKWFIERCGKDNTHAGILSWHHYDTLPEDHLRHINRVKQWIAPYPNLRDALLVNDEWNPMNPDGNSPLAANEYAAAQTAATINYMFDGGLEYHAFFITLFGGRRNGLVQPNGTVNPTFNVLKMYSMMGADELTATVPDAEPYVGALATARDDGNATILVWHAKYRSDVNKDTPKNVTVSLGAKHAGKKATVYFIDKTLSNGYNNATRQHLEKTGAFTFKDGALSMEMPANSVALIITE